MIRHDVANSSKFILQTKILSVIMSNLCFVNCMQLEYIEPQAHSFVNLYMFLYTLKVKKMPIDNITSFRSIHMFYPSFFGFVFFFLRFNKLLMPITI